MKEKMKRIVPFILNPRLWKIRRNKTPKASSAFYFVFFLFVSLPSFSFFRSENAHSTSLSASETMSLLWLISRQLSFKINIALSKGLFLSHFITNIFFRIPFIIKISLHLLFTDYCRRERDIFIFRLSYKIGADRLFLFGKSEGFLAERDALH